MTTNTIQGRSSRRQIDYHRISCAELDAATYDLEYLIDGALVAGQPCILAGNKKSMKTSILIDLGISLAMGGCFLGKLRVNRACRVGIMTGESGLATIQETARRICRAAGYQLADISGLVWSEQVPQFGDLRHLDALRRFLTNDELEVVIIDPAYMCIPDVDHGNLFEVGARLRGVSQVCQESGAMLLLAHHNRKAGKTDPFSPPELEDIAWAGFQEFARQWLLVGRRDAYEPGSGEHRLWLSAGGSAGHSALWAVDIAEGTRATPGGRFWQVNLMPASDARQQANARNEARKTAQRQAKEEQELETDRKAIVKGIVKLNKPDTMTGIRARSGLGNGQRFDRAWASLLADETVRQAGVGKKGNGQEYESYQLARAEDEP